MDTKYPIHNNAKCSDPLALRCQNVMNTPVMTKYVLSKDQYKAVSFTCTECLEKLNEQVIYKFNNHPEIEEKKKKRKLFKFFKK